jgi:hypothetical protein
MVPLPSFPYRSRPMPNFRRSLAVALLAAAVAPAADPPVRLSPTWTKGDKVEYDFTKGRERTKDGKVVLSGSTTTPITVEVLKVGKDEVEIGWTFGEVKFNDPVQAKNPQVKALGNIMKGRRVVFTLDPAGGVTGVKNFDELAKASDEIYDALAAVMKESGAAKAQVDQVMAVVKGMFAKREQTEMMWLKDPAALFFPVGEQLEVGKPKETEQELPNPLGGDPFPTKRTVELTKADAKAGTATITASVAFDEKAAEKILNQTIKDLTKQLGTEPPNADAIKGFRITDAAEYTVSTKTGWVEKAKVTRTMKQGDGVQVDTQEFVRKGK